MKIDWSAMQGYHDGMTAEEKLALLEESGAFVSKSSLDKAMSEAAERKRMIETMRAEVESGESKHSEELASIRKELDAMRREKTISEYTAQFIGQGYSPELAANAAKAFADGDSASVFKAMTAHAADEAKRAETDNMRKTPAPPVGKTSSSDDQLDDACRLAREIGKSRAAADELSAKTIASYVGG